MEGGRICVLRRKGGAMTASEVEIDDKLEVGTERR